MGRGALGENALPFEPILRTYASESGRARRGLSKSSGEDMRQPLRLQGLPRPTDCLYDGLLFDGLLLDRDNRLHGKAVPVGVEAGLVGFAVGRHKTVAGHVGLAGLDGPVAA